MEAKEEEVPLEVHITSMGKVGGRGLDPGDCISLTFSLNQENAGHSRSTIWVLSDDDYLIKGISSGGY